MVEKEYVSPPVTVKKALVFNQKDFYRHLKKSFRDHGYTVNEKSHDESLTPEGEKKVAFSWVCKKKVSGYVKFVIEMDFESVFRDVKVKMDESEVGAQKGSVALKFRSLIEKDTESEWELRKRSPFTAFFRELYDKVVGKERFDDVSKAVESDMKAVMEESKLFLKMRRYD